MSGCETVSRIRVIIDQVRNLELIPIEGINEIDNYLDTKAEEATPHGT